MSTALREALLALSDDELRLTVQIAFHALDDAVFVYEVADLVDIPPEQLVEPSGFAHRVLAPLFDLTEPDHSPQGPQP